MARVRLKGNFQQFIDDSEEMAQAFQNKRGIRIRIRNEVEYFLFVEYGTSVMDARAMVRNAMRAAVRMFEELWHMLPYPFLPDDIDDLCELVKDFWIEEILKRTPEITGTLKRGMEGAVETY